MGGGDPGSDQFLVFLAPLAIGILLIGRSLLRLGPAGLITVPPLALQRFAVNRQSEPYVEIIGRRRGLIAFLLTLIGFSNRYRLVVGRAEVRCEKLDAAEPQVLSIPIHWVATVCGGSHRRLWMLVIAGCLFVLSVLTLAGMMSGQVAANDYLVPTLFWAFLAVALIVLYFVSKSFRLEFHPHGGPPIVVDVMPSIFDGMWIDPRQVGQALTMCRHLLLSQAAVPVLTRESAPPAMLHDGFDDAAAQGPSLPVPSVPVTPGIDVPWPESQPSVSPMFPAATTVDEGIVVPEQRIGSPDAEGRTGKGITQAQEQDARAAFAEARQLFQAGQKREAVAALRQLIRQFPRTEAARHARRNLESIGRLRSRDEGA